ncbi:MAG: lipopolysaccharide biosynthesis protein [Anaerocolumna sp.]
MDKKMTNSRTINSLRNAVVGVTGQFFVFILQFVCRTVFVSTLPTDYLGVNGLFFNIINILSLSELGFGAAFLYSMYGPMVEQDYKKITQILNLYRRIYLIIAAVIFLVGLLFTPLLGKIVGNHERIPNLEIIYLLFLLNSVASYIWIYKKSLIEASQQNYICSIYQKGTTVLLNISQIIFLLVTHNYIIYLVLQIASNIISNWLISLKAEKMFPQVDKKDKSLPNQMERSKIFNNTKALAFHRIGWVLNNNTDNFIMSIFTSMFTVGIYSNYTLLITNLSIFINVILSSFSASVGNMGITESSEKSREVFHTLHFISFWIYSLCGICLMNLLNPFITIWIGHNYLLPMGLVIIIVINFYIYGMRIISFIYVDAYGIAYDTKYKSIVEAFINILASIILVRQFGLIGIFIGTTIAYISVFWREVVSIYKKIFKCMPSEYFKNYAKYALFFAIANIITYRIGLLIPDGDIFLLIMKAILIVVMYHILLYAMFAKFRRLLSIGRGKIKLILLGQT